MMNIDTAKSHGHLIAPHGGELVDLRLNPESAAEVKARSKDFPSWDLTSRQIRDLELLMSGGFSPLRGFMNRKEYERVCHEMRLRNGMLWPIPITLDVPDAFAKSLKPGSSKIALRDSDCNAIKGGNEPKGDQHITQAWIGYFKRQKAN